MFFDMKQRILLSSVLYPTKHFNSFSMALLDSIKHQKYKTFSLLLFLDGIEILKIKSILNQFNISQEIILLRCNTGELTPSQIRQKIINFAYEHFFNILIFCDFDEKITLDRIKHTVQFINKGNDFAYCDAYITDKNFNIKKNTTLFHLKNIPMHLNCINPILRRNFIGMGGLAIKLDKADLYNLYVPNDILVFDWFLATHMLLNQWIGGKIKKCLVYYRQHNENHIGTNTELNHTKLKLGIQVKKKHYLHFSSFNTVFYELYNDILLLEKYVLKNEEKYIKIINENFHATKMCWWENIKTLKEIKQWI